MIEIVTPATDPNLLSIAEARVLAGLAGNDTSQDATLNVLIDRVSADVYSACRIKRGKGHPRTIRKETIREKKFVVGGDRLILARRHEITLTSVLLSGVAQDISGYVVESDQGVVYTIDGTNYGTWARGLVEIVYEAGFDDVPPDLLGIASDLFRIYHAVDTRDPGVKSVRIDVDDIEEIETQYFAPTTATTSPIGLPTDIAARLKPYQNGSYA